MEPDRAAEARGRPGAAPLQAATCYLPHLNSSSTWPVKIQSFICWSLWWPVGVHWYWYQCWELSIRTGKCEVKPQHQCKSLTYVFNNLWKESSVCRGLITEKYLVSVLLSTGMQVLVLYSFSITVVLAHPLCEPPHRKKQSYEENKVSMENEAKLQTRHHSIKLPKEF